MTFKKNIRAFFISVLCAALTVPVTAFADSRGESRQERRSTHSGGSRGHRPGNNSQNHGNRPGSNGHNQGTRPGNSGHGQNQGHRPGGGHAVNRPGGNHTVNRPGGNHAVNRPGHTPPPSRPGHTVGNRPWHLAPPPHRPYRPAWRAWSRPVPPPPAWRPYPRAPRIGTILGLAFGTALATSVDYLINAGYTVDGYQNGVVYLSDISQLNYMWPDAMLYYDNGCLVGSEYAYSTPYADQSRYTMVYNSLAGVYGAPVSVSYPAAGAVLTTWYAPGNGYISLRYAPVSSGGAIRYFTTMTVGRY